MYIIAKTLLKFTFILLLNPRRRSNKQHIKNGTKFINADLYINFRLGFITYAKNAKDAIIA